MMHEKNQTMSDVCEHTDELLEGVCGGIDRRMHRFIYGPGMPLVRPKPKTEPEPNPNGGGGGGTW